MKFGTVALVGRSNVGKSTFLNAVLGEPLAIVSPLPQTTRDTLLGVVTRPEAQLAFLDTPGLHRAHTELGRRMNAAALEAARSTDLLLFMTDVTSLLPRPGAGRAGKQDVTLLPEDQDLIAKLPAGPTAIAAINKVDRVRNKSLLLPLLEALGKSGRFTSIVPVSVRNDDGVDRILAELEARLPEGPAGYEADTLTDRPTSFFVREYVREQIMLATGREVPHAVAVSIDRIDDTGKLLRCAATIHVEKAGQRAILIGQGGQMIGAVGTAARARLEHLLGRRVHLELFVRVTPRWKNMPRQLAELGYEQADTESADPTPSEDP